MAEWNAPKTDWVTNPKNPVAEDFNRIEGNIAFLKQDIETKKGLIVDAINDMNQPAQVTDAHAQLASKIRDISKDATAAVGDVEKGKTFYAGGQKRTGTLALSGTAGTGDVLSGKTFYNTALKTKRTGTMPNRGAVVITPSTSNQTIQAGYHNGSGYVKGDANLRAANILKGKSIFGIAGNADRVATGSGMVSSDSKLTVRNLGFTPSIVYVRAIEPYADIYYGQMIERGLGGAGRSSLWVRSGGGNTGSIDHGGDITIQSSGFDASFNETIRNITAYWIAIG